MPFHLRGYVGKRIFRVVDLNYWLVLVADELVAADDTAAADAGGVAAGSTMTVRVEVLVRPWLSVTT